MAYFLQQLVNGLTVGCVYGLVAMGYTMVHAIIGQINLAQGAIFMIGAFSAYIAITLLGILGLGATPAALLLALLLAVIVTAAHGWVSHRVVFRPLVRHLPGHAPLIAAIGLAIFLKEYVRLLQNAGDFWLPPMITGGFRLFESGPFTLWLGYRNILIVALTGVVLAAHGLLVARTSLGRAQRACAQDPGMAALVGLNVARTVGSTYALAAALAAVAGMVVTVHYGVINFFMGFLLGLKAFTAAIVGGIGSLPGAALGGLIIGLLETLYSAYFDLLYKDVVVFGVLVLTLVFRPDGLLGRPIVTPLFGAGAARR